MSPQEFDNSFDVLYNNVSSNQAPGLNAYEKSLFLTKAQDEVLKNYFNPKSNKLQEGFDGNRKRQIDFSTITKVAQYSTTIYRYEEDESVKDGNGFPTYEKIEETSSEDTYSYTQAYDKEGNAIENHYIRGEASVGVLSESLFDRRSNSRSASLPSDVMMIINEKVTVNRGNTTLDLTVVPITFDEYDRLMSKPFKRPLKYQAWRLINNSSANKSDLIVGPTDNITNYIIRYVKRPNPIIVSDLDGLTINGFTGASGCELDETLHEEILQRAVELAKIAWAGDAAATIQTGQRSE